MRAGHEKGFPRERRLVFSPSSSRILRGSCGASVRTGRFFIRPALSPLRGFSLSGRARHEYDPRQVHLRIFAALGVLAALVSATALRADALPADGFLSPAGGATLTAGAVAEARWLAPDASALHLEEFDEAELVLSLDGGLTFPVRISAELAPGASTYRWRVPALATQRARLALRVGVEHERERERIILVGPEFVIDARAPESDPGGLIRGASEWWTAQALTERSARDLLETSVASTGERLVSVATETDADQRAPSLSLPPPSRCAACATSPVGAARATARVAPRPVSSPGPLRL